MKAETLHHDHPPTPPTFHPELHSGLHHIAEYVADRSLSYDESHHRGSSYGSPGPVIQEPTHHTAQSFHGYPAEGRSNSVLGIQYDGYGNGTGQYQESPYGGTHYNQTMIAGSPPTPRSAAEFDEAERRTRSGRAIAPPSPPQAESSPKSKSKPKSRPTKKAKGKADKPKTPKLTQGLSILTKHMTSIPVRNMKEWVERSAETRRQEVEKRNGYITRPMNSFMLYRSAYAERTKQWCLQNNHQVVSSVSGESWPMEPPEIRELYNEYAKIERINHQAAHPDYKFSPSKAVAPAKKRKDEFSGDELSDLEWEPERGRSKGKRPKRQGSQYEYPTNTVHTHSDFFWDPSNATNAGAHPPMQMQSDPYNQYFQTHMHPSMGMSPTVMDDMRMRRMDTPSSLMQLPQGEALLGLPGGNAADMMQHLHSHVGTPLGEEGQVDPMLLAYDGPRHSTMEPTMVTHHGLANGHMGMMTREYDQDSVHSFLGQEPPHEEFQADHWQSDPNLASMEQGSEFEKWMDDHHAG